MLDSYLSPVLLALSLAGSSGQSALTVVSASEALPVSVSATSVSEAESGTLVMAERGMIGVYLAGGEEAAVIQETMAGGPAEKAGLMAGDTIKAVNGFGVASPSELTALVSRHSAGQGVSLTIDRGGWSKDVELVLAPASSLGQAEEVVELQEAFELEEGQPLRVTLHSVDGGEEEVELFLSDVTLELEAAERSEECCELDACEESVEWEAASECEEPAGCCEEAEAGCEAVQVHGGDPLIDWDAIHEEMASMGSGEVSVHGGDPLIDWDAIHEEMASMGSGEVSFVIELQDDGARHSWSWSTSKGDECEGRRCDDDDECEGRRCDDDDECEGRRCDDDDECESRRCDDDDECEDRRCDDDDECEGRRCDDDECASGQCPLDRARFEWRPNVRTGAIPADPRRQGRRGATWPRVQDGQDGHGGRWAEGRRRESAQGARRAKAKAERAQPRLQRAGRQYAPQVRGQQRPQQNELAELHQEVRQLRRELEEMKKFLQRANRGR